jgi:hypothetical protein
MPQKGGYGKLVRESDGIGCGGASVGEGNGGGRGRTRRIATPNTKGTGAVSHLAASLASVARAASEGGPPAGCWRQFEALSFRHSGQRKHPMKYPTAASPLVAGVIACALSVTLPSPAVGQEVASPIGERKPESGAADILRAQAEQSEKAFQAAVAAVHELSGVLQAEASQSTAATRRDSEAIQHVMDLFLWIVAVVSAVLLAGASLLAWALAAWGKASKTDIEKAVKTQTNVSIQAAIAADKPRFDSMMDIHLQQTKCDLTKLMQTQVKEIVDQFRSQLQEMKESVEVIAEAVENDSGEGADAPGLPEPSKGEQEATASAIGQMVVSNKELSILKALWIKPKSRRTIYNIANDSNNPIEETRQVLSALIQKNLVEILPHSRTGRPLYRRTGRGVALTDSRFRAASDS